MSDDQFKHHVPHPKNTPAFFCANCGAVALDANTICKVQGRGTKADWCGTDHAVPPQHCHNRVHNLRYRCKKCGQVSVNPGLLCEPEQMQEPV